MGVVKALKERFLRGKGSPCLNQIDVHVICGTVKDFLRSLHEPLVTYGLWKKFVQAVETSDPIDVRPALYQVISELPQPNRDTLAYMMLHLQRYIGIYLFGKCVQWYLFEGFRKLKSVK